MKINIALNIVEGPFGGSHKFLGALKCSLQSKGIYEENPFNADIIIFSASQNLPYVVRLKNELPSTPFIHRIDGPIRLYNSRIDIRDLQILKANRFLADGTIFQSSWSKNQNIKMGFRKNIYETIITNAPDPRYFNKKIFSCLSFNRKIRLVSTSWSSNFKKGFSHYKWLDENLDFSKFRMTFIGNSPIHFKNIHHLPPMNSKELASELKKNDIFITASEKDPCSNSLIEALHCGLPVIALRDGGHPELVANSGELFQRVEEVPTLLNKITKHYINYHNSICNLTLEDVSNEYYAFLKNIYQEVQLGKYIPKKLSTIKYYNMMISLFCWRFYEKTCHFFKRRSEMASYNQ